MSPTLLRKSLEWPVLWRWAAEKAASAPHTRGYCLPCLAKARIERNEHALGEATSGVGICKKCGLLKEQWKSSPKCSNKRPLVALTRSVLPTYRILEVD